MTIVPDHQIKPSSLRLIAWDGLVAGVIAGFLSGIPSTLVALIQDEDIWRSTRIVGSLVAPDDWPSSFLLLIGGAIHMLISVGWAFVLSFSLPRRFTWLWGLIAGLAIAALDLGLIGQQLEPIRALAPMPQLADHVAFGLVTGLTLQWMRNRQGHGH